MKKNRLALGALLAIGIIGLSVGCQNKETTTTKETTSTREAPGLSGTPQTTTSTTTTTTTVDNVTPTPLAR